MCNYVLSVDLKPAMAEELEVIFAWGGSISSMWQLLLSAEEALAPVASDMTMSTFVAFKYFTNSTGKQFQRSFA